MTVSDLNQRFSNKDQWPSFIEIITAPAARNDSNVFKINCDIPSNLSWFKGHFPDQAVLPGVVQVNWANELAETIFSLNKFRGINSLKFNTMILPESQVTLSLTLNPEKNTVKFDYKSNDTLYSSGTLVFAVV